MKSFCSKIMTFILSVFIFTVCCSFDCYFLYANHSAQQNQPTRLYEEEIDLFSKLYDNGNGSKTLYIYSEDVKYLDENGSIRDKSTAIKDTHENGYAMTDNNVKAFFPKNIDDGVRIEYENYIIQTKPFHSGYSAATLENESVVYSGDGIKYKYVPLYSGVEELTILEHYTGVSDFKYVVSTDNLYLDQADDVFCFRDDMTQKKIFEVGDALIIDASGSITKGSMKYDHMESGYLLTISVEDEFLRKSTYPVIIDPSYTINTSSGIEDTTVYQSVPDLNTGSWSYNHAGFVTGYGKGRILVRIPGFYESSLFQSLNAAQVTAATFSIKEATGSAPQRINLYSYNGNTWTESSATWNNTSPNSFGSLIDFKNMSFGYSSDFNILSLVRGWLSGQYDASKGFILINSNETNAGNVKAVFSAETSDPPCLTITYDDINPDVAGKTYLIRNNITGQFLQLSNNGSLSVGGYTGEVNQKWEFQNIGNGSVRIVSLSDLTPSDGDHTYVLRSNMIGSVSANSGNFPYLNYPNQCWICIGSLNSLRIRSVEYPGLIMYQNGTGVMLIMFQLIGH